ncbi:FixH family protein [Roseomonas sp. BN140053]|uniref:FixH family protein n=1 Tax=Roseomonas sp. BN140053 TaxID=3391898 RepID=UPI0039ECFE1E
MLEPKCGLPGTVVATLLLVGSMPGGAGAADLQDYEVQLVTPQVRQGDGVTVAVRLVQRTTGRPVHNAVLYGTRLDMSPDDMATMIAPLVPVAGGEPGVYRFRTNLSMTGRWALTLAAKVQGEAGTLRARLILQAAP